MIAQETVSGEVPQAAIERHYTKEQPLVYEDAWDLWPYAFCTDNGEEMGYNIDLVKAIMEKLDIPYIVKLKKRSEVLKDLKEGRADLTLGMEAHFNSPYGKFGKVLVHLFTHSLVWPVGQPQRIFSLSDLGHEKLYVHQSSYSHHLMQTYGCQDQAIPLDNMKEAILQLSEKKDGQILWNTASLKSLLHMYGIENLQIASINMNDGEYKFMSNNEHLLQIIDQAYNELDVEGSLTPLQNKWFYPEEQVSVIPSWLWMILNVSVILTTLLIVFAVWIFIRGHKAVERGKKRTRRLALIMNTSHVSIWLFNVKKRKFTWLDKDGVARQEYPFSQMAKRVGNANLTHITTCLEQLESQECESAELEVTTFAESNPTGGDRIYIIKFSVLRYEHGKPSVIIAVCTDVYEERKKQQDALDRLSRYRSVFDTALVDMVYYDKNGYVADMNERAQSTFHTTLQSAIDRKTHLNDIVNFKKFNFRTFQYFYADLFLTPDGKPCDFNTKDAKIYEMQLVPMHSEDGQLKCIYGSGRDITETVNTYRALQSSIAEVERANKEVTEYVQNINYVMGVGGVRMAYYSPDSHTLTLYKGLEQVQHTLTQSRCMTLADENSKKKAMRLLNSMDSRTTQSVNADIQTSLRIKGKPLYLQFRFVPTFNAQGRVNGYFGMCRDMSDVIFTERRLKEQTLRAKEVEDLKNSFLRNMSYEIRTPLTTVVGFAELFEKDHTPEDEEIFVQQIKDNSAHLLHLINDILFLSRLDAHMIEINRQFVDFSQIFESFCRSGWGNYQRDGVRYVIENRYDQLTVEIDDTNIGHLIEQLTANAAQHTHKGIVRARYDYMNGQLVIVIEDTGVGMSEEFIKHIYELFSNGIRQGSHKGTGLGLPICKALVNQMGGSIDISSKEGKGTMVCLTIPAKATVIERKNEQ
jgi:signal transduction histidine kinase